MSTPTSVSLPRLATHVRACRVGDQMIFLDLLRNRYFGVAGPQLAALSAVIGVSPAAGDTLDAVSSPAVRAWLRRLRNQDLLIDATAEIPARRHHMVVEPTSSLNVDDTPPAAGADWRHLVRLWRSTLVASTWLRRQSLNDIANHVVTLRARHSDSRGCTSSDGILEAVATYERLRPFALTSHDRCLNDSLTLVHFLALQGLFPKWVIGVRVHPFGAHSWVQSGNVVLNDLAERVRHYQPILVV